MKGKAWLLFLVAVALVAASCGPPGVSPTETPVPSPALSPQPEPTRPFTPSAVSPGAGEGLVMTLGQQGSGEGEFLDPQGLALDRQGNIYVADTGNLRLQVFDPQGGFLTAIADRRFTGPRYVAVDEFGLIYVTDRSETVHVLDLSGNPRQSFGRSGSLPSQFSGIAGLALDPDGELYVADTRNSRVQKFNLVSGLRFTFGDQGEPAELLSRPEGVATDAEGNVYVVDAGNRRIQEYSPGGTFLRSLGGQLSEPRDVAVGGQGNVYVSDAGKDLIQVFDPQGTPLLELGSGQLDDPWGVVVDEKGRVFVVDAGNNRVVVLKPAREVPTPLPTPTSEASPTPTVPPTTQEGPWPMYQGDAQHTGRSLAEGPVTPELKWMFRVGLLANSPAVGADGNVYCGSLDGNLYAVSPAGAELWRAPVGQISGVPAISDQGVIYVGAASPVEEMFHAFDRAGDVSWAYQSEFHVVESSPIIGPDGTIYLAASSPLGPGGALVALNPDGSEKWRYDVGSGLPFSPALGHDGTVYVGAENGNLYALDPVGGFKWQTALGAVNSSPAVGGDGTLYIGAGASYQALNPEDGSQVWAFAPAAGEADCTPSVGRERVYLVSTSNELYALERDGSLIWTFAAEEEEEREVHFSSPVTIDGAGVIYAGTKEGELFAVNPDGSLRWRFPLPEGGVVLIGPAIGSDGTLYVGAGFNLYAVGQ